MSHLLYTAVSLFALAISCVRRPEQATCADGWYVATLRPDGSFECEQSPPRDERDCTKDLVCPQPVGESIGIQNRIYCSGGATPIVVDHRTVGCQRGGWGQR